MASPFKRTDCHRPGAIVPADYVPVLDYSLSTSEGGFNVPSFGVNCELDRRYETKDETTGKTIIHNGEHDADGQCCVLGLLYVARVQFAETGNTGKCSICGARFIYGSVWRHEPSGEHIHLGHDCADKYEMVRDREDWSAVLESLKQRRAAYIESMRRDQRLETFCARNPGFEAILEIEHPILTDLRSNVRKYGELSEKQISLAIKLASEAYCPERPAERHVAAPEGKVRVRGILVSKKLQEGPYGSTFKGTIKVATPEGSWLAWGTLPDCLLCGNTEEERINVGDEIELTATLTRSDRDQHFAFYKRPTKASKVRA